MFNNLSNNLGNILSKLKGKGVLSEEDVSSAMRQIRVALLEADVSLEVVKEFIKKVKDRALGQEVIKSISPGQMVVKIVQDTLEEILGEFEEINLNSSPPVVIMNVGLQGSGKTTSTAKLALRLKEKQKKKVLVASLDIYRPAAQKQLEVLAKQINVESLEIIENQKPIDITKRAMQIAKLEGYDVLILDTAGRLHIDNELMDELQQVHKISSPTETLLVADSLTGQDAVNIAKEFNDKINLTGIILTRADGDGRGGAALSMRHVTGCPIKFMGVGEKIEEFEPFHPQRIATRILDMGDVVSLVEKAVEQVNQDDAAKLEKKLKKGKFDLDDLASQFKMMRRMGGVGSIVGMMPGLGKMKNKIDEAGGIDEKVLIRTESIIYSMTKQEKRYPKIINGSRKKRIAKGAGVEVQEVNRLLKQHKQMSTMMKKFGKMDKKKLMRSDLVNKLNNGGF